MSSGLTGAIIYSPLLIVATFALALLLEVTREMVLFMILENHPVELLTFVFLLLGGIFGVVLSRRAWTAGEQSPVWGFYLLFAVGLLVTGMEEVAWGQWFFRFETPAAVRDLNVQREFTLHNIETLHGHTEFFRLAFGLGGLIGIGLAGRGPFQKIGVPSVLLLWFLCITVLSGLDLYNDYLPLGDRLDFTVRRLSEVVEMMIGMAGFLYLWLNAKVLAVGWRKAGAFERAA